jgi:hypothetical protein
MKEKQGVSRLARPDANSAATAKMYFRLANTHGTHAAAGFIAGRDFAPQVESWQSLAEKRGFGPPLYLSDEKG